MGIEKDINQAKFTSERQKAIINIIFTSNWMNERMKLFFDKEDITAQQYNILRILRGACKPISTLQIRQSMLDRMSDTSRIVDRLLAKEYVKKDTCENDKRLVDVSITVKGKKLLEKMDRSAPEMEQILDALNDADLKLLNKILDKIRSK